MMTVSLTSPNVSTPTSNLPSTSDSTVEKDEIWSSILKGVASSKMVQTKHVLVLGDPGCGKSTIVHYLKRDPGPQQPKGDSDDMPSASFVSSSANYTVASMDKLDDDATNSLALGYTYIDIQDEDNEAMARLGVYQLGLSASEYLALLKFALSVDTLADALVLIVLDWTRPWSFMEVFQRWINVLEHVINEIRKEGSAGESWSRGRAVVDELKEKVEHYLQTYTDSVNAMQVMSSSTSTHTSAAAPASTTTGTPTNTNEYLSAPLVTTTTAADQVTLPLTQGCLTKNLGVPIVVVCHKSDALETLDQTQSYNDDQYDYIQQTLRCVCMKYGAALFYTSTLRPYTFHNLRQYILHRVLTTSSRTFPFPIRAQVVERDCVLVPAGWDSWGKIRVLREGFDCEGVNAGWDADMEAVMDRQPPGAHGARSVYEEGIPNREKDTQPLSMPPTVICEDEQIFLERHYETLQRTPEVGRQQGTGARPSALGHLGMTSVLDKMSTERQNTGIGMSKLVGESGSPTSAGVGVNGAASNEVLANFFQTLLSKKPAGSGVSSSVGDVSRAEVTKEIHRMNEYNKK